MPKATLALPKMGENGQAPIKKGIENNVEYGTYQCPMPPTGLPEPAKKTRLKHLRGQKGNAAANTRDTSNPEHPTDLVADLDYLSDKTPTPEVFTERGCLKLTHHNWNGRLNKMWYNSVGFRKTKPRLTVIGNIPIQATDPQQSSSCAGWHLLGQQIISQRE